MTENSKPSSPKLRQHLQTYSQVFANRSMLAMLLLGFASGLPLALTATAMQAWLTVEGLSLKSIGYFGLVALPYTFKFVWAPLMDRFEPAFFGRRRSWIAISQIALALTCFAIATVSPKTDLPLLASLCVALAFLSASQDIVFDAYRADLLKPEERGTGAAITVLGYRLGMLVSGGVALILADRPEVGWPNTYRFMGLVFALFVLVTWWVPKLPPINRLATSARVELTGFVAMLGVGAGIAIFILGWPILGWQGLVPDSVRADKWQSLLVESGTIMLAFTAAIWVARKVGFPSFVTPWDSFMTQPAALGLLALVVLYKLGDAFAATLSTTFLIKGVGFSQTEVGAVNKVSGMIATIIGALFGGIIMAKLTLFRALLIFGVLQAVSNLSYWFLSVTPKSLTTMTGAIWFENLCGGMGSAAFVAFMMALTDKRFSAAQLALLSALAAIGRVFVGPTAGVLVEAVGWPQFFLITVLTALPGLALLLILKPRIEALAKK
jgi:MFS transporter, PAT family, beta-lactamase induction signal transducer AmpG